MNSTSEPPGTLCSGSNRERVGPLSDCRCTESRRLHARTIVLALVLPAMLAACARGDDHAGSISGVSIGLSGAVKVGRWTPVSFDIAGEAGAIVQPAITAPDPDGSDTTWKLPPVTLDATGHGRAAGVYKLGRRGGTVRVSADAATLTLQAGPDSPDGDRPCTTYTQDVSFVGVLGAAAGIETAFAAVDAAGNRVQSDLSGRLVKFETVEGLPVQGAAYDALDVIVLSQQFDLDEGRSTALADWVRAGGRLVVALGSDPQPFTNSPVSSWIPVVAHEAAAFGELASLTGRVPGSPPVAVSLTSPVGGVRIQADDAVILAGSLSGPLAVRTTYGLGRVTVLAVDWNDNRLATWPGLPGLCRYLGELEPAASEQAAGQTVQLRPTGISELATQLTAMLDHFPVVQRPSYWTVILFAVAFMLLVGPLDYLLVHRVLKQPRLTWFTFPAWILFAAAAATMGADRLNSAERLSNQFDLVDVDAVSGQLQLHSWLTVYSPEPRRLAANAKAAAWLSGDAERTMRISWSGAPETGFGGMYRSGGLNLANPPYTFDREASAVENVPIGQWSSKALSSNWAIDGPTSSGPLVTSNLADDGTGLLTGSFTHHLPDAITDYCVAYGTAAYFPSVPARVEESPSIAPGVSWNPEDRDHVSRRLLVRYLQGLHERYHSDVKITGSATTLTTDVYDPLGLDPYPLARILTFFTAVNGPNYTGLANFSLDRSDLSPLLPLKRAIVFGRIASPAAEYDVDGAPLRSQERWTFVRLVLPVKPGVAPTLKQRGDLEIR